MRNTKQWFKLLTILASSGLLLSGGCGWPIGVDIFYAGLVTFLAAGAAIILANGNGGVL